MRLLKPRLATEYYELSGTFVYVLISFCLPKDMFTGLIEEVGNVLGINVTSKGTQLQIGAPHIAKKIRTGDSVAVNGCCLTLSAHRGEELIFDLLEETLDRTNLKTLRRDGPVNLERSLPANGRFGGHFVQGHVDCAARILAFEQSGGEHRLEIELPAEFAHYVASKGSIAWIIPHTKHHTNLDRAAIGDLVNLEVDVLAKYVERMLSRHEPKR